MKRWLALSRGIDGFSQRLGRATSWLALAMVLMGAFNALARYGSRFTGVSLSSNAFIEAQWYMFSALFLLAAGYTLQRNEHVRVDVLYGRVSPKTQAWINLVGTILFLIPFCILMILVCTPAVISSWSIWEQSPDPGGLPRYPIKTLVPLAFVLLILQAFSELIKNLGKIRGHLPLEDDDPSASASSETP